jgi:transposase
MLQKNLTAKVIQKMAQLPAIAPNRAEMIMLRLKLATFNLWRAVLMKSSSVEGPKSAVMTHAAGMAHRRRDVRDAHLPARSRRGPATLSTSMNRLARASISSSGRPTPQSWQSLMGLKAVGPTTPTVLTYEYFGWRQFGNRRQVGSLAGLTPTPYQSGASNHAQAISKADNVRVRWIVAELAWSWLHFQPESPLSHWYQRRFGGATSRNPRDSKKRWSQKASQPAS